jgi:phospholipid/cholesterol/gamma-HCH transport system substrate-binding protein
MLHPKPNRMEIDLMIAEERYDVSEVIAGTIVVVVAMAITLLAFMSSRIAGMSGYDLDVRFAKVDGLAVGSEVRVSGVKIGALSGLDLDPTTYLVTAHMNLPDEIRLPVDSFAEVIESGLLGNPYVAILPGKAKMMLPVGGLITKSCGSEDFMSMVARFGLNNGQPLCHR